MTKPEGAGVDYGYADAAFSGFDDVDDAGAPTRTSPRMMLAFSLAGLGFGVFYLVWFSLAYSEPVPAMKVLSAVTAAVFASGIFLSHTRFATTAAIAIVTFAALILVPYTAVLSTASDVHLLYLAVGFAMLALFPEHLWKVRAAYAAAIIVLVMVCEFAFTTSLMQSALNVAHDDLVVSANRMWTVMVIAMGIGVLLLRSTRRQRDLSGVAAREEMRANTDPMTGIANRRPVLVRLRELDRDPAATYGIAIIDIDMFKNINDKLGHEEGDALITAIARRLRAHFRQTDMVSRWGGDEFLVLMPSMSQEHMADVLERLRASVAESPFALGAEPIPVTLSIGAAMALPGDDSRAMINKADQALYTAKKTGRNRVVVAQNSVTETA